MTKVALLGARRNERNTSCTIKIGKVGKKKNRYAFLGISVFIVCAHTEQDCL